MKPLAFISLLWAFISISYGQDILSLKDGSTIPCSIILNTPSQDLATVLIQRLHWKREQNLKKIPGYVFDYMADTRILMAFPSQYIESIQAGCFQNLHETKTGRGWTDLGIRALAEDKFLGLKIEESYGSLGKKANYLRPKYAFLAMEKYFPEMGLTVMHAGYGDIFAKLKNDVKKRSTWTSGDSLGRADNPEEFHTFFRKSVEMVPSPEPGYFEAQIWGRLCLEDVEYFLVGCFEDFPNPDRLLALKKTNIPIYLCHPQIKQGRYAPHNLQPTGSPL